MRVFITLFTRQLLVQAHATTHALALSHQLCSTFYVSAAPHANSILASCGVARADHARTICCLGWKRSVFSFPYQFHRGSTPELKIFALCHLGSNCRSLACVRSASCGLEEVCVGRFVTALQLDEYIAFFRFLSPFFLFILHSSFSFFFLPFPSSFFLLLLSSRLLLPFSLFFFFSFFLILPLSFFFPFPLLSSFIFLLSFFPCSFFLLPSSFFRRFHLSSFLVSFSFFLFIPSFLLFPYSFLPISLLPCHLLLSALISFLLASSTLNPPLLSASTAPLPATAPDV